MAYIVKGHDGQELQHNGEPVWRTDLTTAIKSVSLESRSIAIIGSTESKDRDGDIVETKGWELDNYLKNPVFMWAHDHAGVPLGAATKVIRKKGPSPHLLFHIRFPSEVGVYPFADMILNLYSDGIIKGASVGFKAKQWADVEPDPAQTQMSPFMDSRGRRFQRQELLELSGVAIPSNPDALTSALKGFNAIKSWDDAKVGRFAELLLSGEAQLEDAERDRVMEAVEGMVGKGAEFVDEYEPTKVFMPGEKKEDPPEVKAEEKTVTMTEAELLELLEFAGANAVAEHVEELNKLAEAEEQKAGAVLNAKNKSLLREAASNIEAVLKSGDKPGDEDGKQLNQEYWDKMLEESEEEEPKDPGQAEPVSQEDKDTANAPVLNGFTEQDIAQLSEFVTWAKERMSQE